MLNLSNLKSTRTCHLSCFKIVFSLSLTIPSKDVDMTTFSSYSHVFRYCSQQICSVCPILILLRSIELPTSAETLSNTIPWIATGARNVVKFKVLSHRKLGLANFLWPYSKSLVNWYFHMTNFENFLNSNSFFILLPRVSSKQHVFDKRLPVKCQLANSNRMLKKWARLEISSCLTPTVFQNVSKLLL